MEKENVVVVEEESQGLTIKDIFFMVRKHIIAIIVFVVVFTIAGYIATKLLPPTYKSSGSMMVSYESSNGAITSDYTFSNYITTTYVEFIKEDAVLDIVSERTGISTATIKSNMSVSNKSLLITISYKSSDAEEAKMVTNTIIDTAQEVADSTVNVGGEEKPVYHLLYDNLKVLTYAKTGTIQSHTLRNVAIGLAVGVVLAFAYVALRELFDNSFKSSSELERMLGIPVLAGIPEYEFEDEKKAGK